MNKIEIKKIDMYKEYVAQLVMRVALFALVLWAYIKYPHYFDLIYTKTMQLRWQAEGLDIQEIKRVLESQYNIWYIYIIWAIFMLSMIVQMLPETKRITMGAKKNFERNFHQVEGHDRLELFNYVQRNNFSAAIVLLVWLGFNGIFGALFVLNIIHVKELVLLSCFYYVSDLICVVIWCPFQSFIMKNRCCVNCRIFNWGYFMMFTPMLFIRNVLTWSLFFMSLLLVIRWEMTLIKYPERFWEGSNEILKCENCQDKICKFKKPRYFDENGKRVSKPIGPNRG